jgi:fatty-acyl-CoA synthase
MLAAQLDSLASSVGCRLVLAEPDLAGVGPPGLTLSWDAPEVGPGPIPSPEAAAPSGPSAPSPPSGPTALEPADPGATAVLQFTSGSTGTPRAAALTHAAVLAAIRNLVAAYGQVPGGDRLAGWLPFFHDHGLFGYLVRPLVAGWEGHLLPTRSFARDPVGWFRLVTRTEATITSGPCSAWAAALRAAMRQPEGLDLSSLRVAGLAAETINPEVVRAMATDGARLGLRPEAVTGAYGMAEATLGVTVTEPGRGLRIDRVEPATLASSGRAVPATGEGAKAVASCGRPIPGAEVRVVGPDGPLPDRHVGEILVTSPSLMTGYVGSAGAEQPFADPAGRWLRTGDLGYLAEGELFFTGRSKDVVVVMGRNHAPEDLEWVAERTSGVRPGRVVAFSRTSRGREEAVVAVEAADGCDPTHVAGAVAEATFDALGFRPTEVLVLARGAVAKTTSGKLRRSAVRQADAAGTLPVLARA